MSQHPVPVVDSAATGRFGLSLALAAVVPPLVLAGIGLVHPMELSAATAEMWRDMHIVLLPLFPLLALGPWLVVRRSAPRLAWITALLGYVYAAFYSALDVLAGIGAGGLQLGGYDGVGTLYRLGDALALPGTIALLLASLLASVVAIRRDGWVAAIGGVLVVVASVSYLTSHIFAPRGVLTMVAFAVGWAVLLVGPQVMRRGR